jgi:hypothetical protein
VLLLRLLLLLLFPVLSWAHNRAHFFLFRRSRSISFTRAHGSGKGWESWGERLASSDWIPWRCLY